jgi:hypothetical protein
MPADVTDVRILSLPGLGPNEDVSDWLARDGTGQRLIALAAKATPVAPSIPTTGTDAPSNPPRVGGAPPASDTTLASIPALPLAAVPSAEAHAAARAVRAQWLDPFIDAAQARTPRSARSLLEACGVFAICLAVARRCFVRTGGTRHFPALYMLFVGRSTLVAKTTALNTLRGFLSAAGLTDLLLPSSFTAPALLADLALSVPPKVCEGTLSIGQRWLEQHRHGAARGILRDEADGLFADCDKDYNTGLLPLLLKLDGAPDYVDSDLTVSRGLIEAHNVCVGLLGATTPAALRVHAAKPYHWHNGLFGRFALIAPDETPAWSFWDESEPFPLPVLRGVQRLYTALPPPSIRFVYTEPDTTGKGAQLRIVSAEQTDYAPIEAALSPAARAAYREYDRALFTLVAQPDHPERMDATYGRLSTLALRVALGLATLDWALTGAADRPVIQVGHWVAAQEMAERWRADAHHILAAALGGRVHEAGRSDVERLLDTLRSGRKTRGTVLRELNWTADQLNAVVAAAGRQVVQTKEQTGGHPAYYLALSDAAERDAPPSESTTNDDVEEGAL